MALLEDLLEIKTSTLPGAGKGLFTKAFIPKGTRIVEYRGRIRTWKQAKQDVDNVYMFPVTAQHVIDARRTKKALARYANDAKGFEQIKGLTNNCRFAVEGIQVYIEAIKDLAAGSELLVSYGKKYWDTLKRNKRIDQQL